VISRIADVLRGLAPGKKKIERPKRQVSSFYFMTLGTLGSLGRAWGTRPTRLATLATPGYLYFSKPKKTDLAKHREE
jgi:hypothetical protein